MNYKRLIVNTLVIYTQLYTQLLSFKNQRLTQHINQLKDGAVIIPDCIISAWGVFYYLKVASPDNISVG